MNYKKVIDRILYNLGIDDENTRTLKHIRYDINDTIKYIYRKSGYPTKSLCVSVADKKITTEDFDDNKYADNFDVNALFNYSALNKRLELNPSLKGIITITNLSGLLTLDIKAFDYEVNNPSAMSELTVKVTDSSGKVLWSDTVILTATERHYLFTPKINCQNPKVRIELLTQANKSSISQVTYTTKSREYKLPDSVFSVVSVTFKDSDNNLIESNEVDFVKLTRTETIYSKDNEVVTQLPKEPTTNQLLYHIAVRESGIYLLWKPEFNGKFELVYYALPTECFNDLDNVPINDAFIDLVVCGATQRGITRRMPLAQSDIELYGLRDQRAECRTKFENDLKSYVGFTRQKTNNGVTRVEPFDYFQDNNMELC